MKILKIKGKNTTYLIFHCENGYYVTCRPKNIFKLLKEYYTDYIGSTYIHPKFLDNVYHSSFDSTIWKINVHENLNLKKEC